MGTTPIAEGRVAARDTYIDVARGIAILLVVLGHNHAISRSSPAFVTTLFLFHVPLFFLISGWVLRLDSPLLAARKLARRLLVPCFAFVVVVGAIKSFTRHESPVQTLIGIVWATGQTLPWSHLWFLPTLFLALMLTQLLGRYLGNRVSRWSLAAVLAAVLAVSLPPFTANPLGNSFFTGPQGLPWSIDLLPICLAFVWLGQLLRQSPSLLKQVLNPLVWVPAIALFAVLVSEARVDLNMRVFTPSVLAMLAAVCGCIVTLRLAAFLSGFALVSDVFAMLGRHTLAIFILHVSIQKQLLQLLEARGQLNGEALWLAGLATALAAIVVSIWLDRFVFARVGVFRFLFAKRQAA